MFEKHKPTKVIHLAAKVGGIVDNIKHPADFIYENVLMNSYVTHYAHKCEVKRLIATLSNCAYPDIAESYPMAEKKFHDGLPAQTNLAYGYAKRLMDIQIKSYRKQHNCKFSSAIPCSIYGPYDKFGEDESHFLSALIKKIFFTNKKGDKILNLIGTGKPLRQYIYSEDLAKILLILLDRYDDEDPVNISSDSNLSIKEIAETAIKVTRSNLKIEFDNKSPDGQYRKDLSSKKLFNIIGNFEFTPLEEGIKKTYEWFKQEEEEE